MLNPDFKEFIELLNRHEVRYLVIGGYAVALHGNPRYTKDLDIWVEMNSNNALQLMNALAEFGFGSVGLVQEDFLIPDQVIQLGYLPNRIDLITTPDGVDFTTCYTSKIEVNIDGITIDFIDLENLKINKKASGRLQDLADLEKLSGEKEDGP
jgi:predicted nucleotidyltransferase